MNYIDPENQMNLAIGWRYNYDDDQAPVTWTEQLTEL